VPCVSMASRSDSQGSAPIGGNKGRSKPILVPTQCYPGIRP
jgi:hypothetical protein